MVISLVAPLAGKKNVRKSIPDLDEGEGRGHSATRYMRTTPLSIYEKTKGRAGIRV
jgi:hypothetical protein